MGVQFPFLREVHVSLIIRVISGLSSFAFCSFLALAISRLYRVYSNLVPFFFSSLSKLLYHRNIHADLAYSSFCGFSSQSSILYNSSLHSRAFSLPTPCLFSSFIPIYLHFQSFVFPLARHFFSSFN